MGLSTRKLDFSFKMFPGINEAPLKSWFNENKSNVYLTRFLKKILIFFLLEIQ